MKAEIISVGTEILLGEITDTNAAFLASELPQLGIDLYWVTQVGDNRGRMLELLQKAWERSDLIILSGGLGPTEDDITRESIAEMLGEETHIDPDLEQWLRDLFEKVGYEMPESNLKQATLVPSAKAIPNPKGSAPGWWVSRDNRILLAMPGPPAEMKRMWKREIKDELRLALGDVLICSRTLKIFGVGEANVDETLGSLLSSDNPTIGVYAKQTGIEVRLTAKAENEETARSMLTPMEDQIRSMFGDRIWGIDEDVIEKVVGDLLLEKGLTLATMESCTGGLLANLITDVPGSSSYFNGGFVTYSNEMKSDYGVDSNLVDTYGAVSSQVAEAMAEAAKTRLNADIGIGITGVAGPEKMEHKPVGTIHIGISDRNGTRSIHGIFPQHRPRIKRFAVMCALNELRCLLLEIQSP